MKQYTTLIAAIVLLVLLAGGLAISMHLRKRDFDSTVQEALKTSDGYDQRFIDMVHRLEEELATRASFGYKGGKDPMTGKKRRVVLPPRQPTKVETKKDVYVDPVKLTAIIFDDEQRKFTAVVMDSERSYSVEVNDRVRDRRITKITDEAIYMESDSVVYRYDIYGKSALKRK